MVSGDGGLGVGGNATSGDSGVSSLGVLSSIMSLSESSVVVVVSGLVVAGSLRNVADGGSSVRLTSLDPSDGI